MCPFPANATTSFSQCFAPRPMFVQRLKRSDPNILYGALSSCRTKFLPYYIESKMSSNSKCIGPDVGSCTGRPTSRPLIYCPLSLIHEGRVDDNGSIVVTIL
ncbi:hypothetical protein LSAT2_022176 [Lamellibrachia satsuma]|nr:hypothetical protein LSAT2_022176 [Lamellibrachia satsuma]